MSLGSVPAYGSFKEGNIFNSTEEGGLTSPWPRTPTTPKASGLLEPLVLLFSYHSVDRGDFVGYES